MTTIFPSREQCTSTSTASALCSHASRIAARVFSGASCEAPRCAMISTLLRQPLLPVLRELVHVLYGHRHQRTHVVQHCRIFLKVDFVDEVFHRAIAPFVNLLRQQ